MSEKQRTYVSSNTIPGMWLNHGNYVLRLFIIWEKLMIKK